MRDNMRLYIEEYKKCGCSIGPLPKSELPGYCALHGNNFSRRHLVPKDLLTEAIKKAEGDQNWIELVKLETIRDMRDNFQ